LDLRRSTTHHSSLCPCSSNSGSRLALFPSPASMTFPTLCFLVVLAEASVTNVRATATHGMTGTPIVIFDILDFGNGSPWGSNPCPIRPSPSARPTSCLTLHIATTTPNVPHPHEVGSLCLRDPTPLCQPERALNGRDASTEPTAIGTAGSSISPLRPIREIFSLCVYLREGAVTGQRKKLFWAIDPSEPSAEEEEGGNGGSAKLDRGVLLTTVRRSHSLQARGNRLLMTVSHSVGKEHCRTVKTPPTTPTRL
jgi:hypothetical protein